MSLQNYFSLHKLLNIFLRISGMGSKFLIFTILSKHFSNAQFGNYSLLISIVTVMIFVLGFDFYNFSIRDILKTKDNSKVYNGLFSSLLLYLIIYCVFFFIGIFVFNQIEYTKEYTYLLIFLCITEHFSQEIYRFLIGFNKVLLANVLLFGRTVFWAVYIFYLIQQNIDFDIQFIFKVWLLSDIITILIPIFLFVNIKVIKKSKIDINWIKKGLKVSVVFFIATLFLKIIEYSNRFIVDAYLGKEITGIYTFYSSIAILVTVYVNTIVISFELPNILKSETENQLNKLFVKFKKSLLIQTIVSSVALLLLIHPILIWQGKEEFKEYLPILYFMIIGIGLMNYSLLYHFKLYVKHFDKELLKALVISGVLSLVVSFILISKLGIYGAAYAFVFSGLILYVNRYIAAKKLKL